MSAKNSPSEIIEPVVSAQTAMVYVMVVAAVADGDLKEDEVKTIADLVDMLPVFKDLTGETARGAISNCTDLLENEDELSIVAADRTMYLPVSGGDWRSHVEAREGVAQPAAEGRVSS